MSSTPPKFVLYKFSTDEMIPLGINHVAESSETSDVQALTWEECVRVRTERELPIPDMDPFIANREGAMFISNQVKGDGYENPNRYTDACS